MSDEEIQIPQADWLGEWDRMVDPRRQRGYVMHEVERLIAEGKPVFHLAIMLPLPHQQDLALSVLRELGYRPRLRLRSGAVPPSVDSEGKPLPSALRGKTLRAKTGYRGDDSSLKQDPIAASRFAASARNVLAKTGSLYVHTDVGFEAERYQLDEASSILRQWGVGVRAKRFRGKTRDTWLVEEVPQEAEKPAAPPPRRGQSRTASAET